MIALGSDHGGFALKEKIKDYLDAHGLEHRDFGCADESSCDYPVYAKAEGEAGGVLGGGERLKVAV